MPASLSSGQFPSVDRLIELASDKDDPGAANPKEARKKSMWKLLLLQLRPFLPYLARLVPMLDVAVGPLQSAGISSDVRKAVAQSMAESATNLQSIQRGLNTATSALDQQSAQLKALEDELARLQQASEKAAAAQLSLSNDLRSVTRLIQIAGLGGIALLIALIVMAAILLAHIR